MTLTPLELNSLLASGEAFRLIDVREPDEWTLARLPQAELIPLAEFPKRVLEELEPVEKIVVYCHHGMRSARAQGFLNAHGYGNVYNLTGGIDLWAKQIDSEMKRY